MSTSAFCGVLGKPLMHGCGMSAIGSASPCLARPARTFAGNFASKERGRVDPMSSLVAQKTTAPLGVSDSTSRFGDLGRRALRACSGEPEQGE
jgi:hypothetical protein